MTSTMITWRRGGTVLAVLALTALLAACGSSNSSTSSASASSTTATTASAGGTGGARGAALRACLKAHGVTLPARRPGTTRPPGGGTPGGGLFGGGGGAGRAGGFAANPKFRAAFQACGAQFGFRGGGAGRFRPSSTTVTAFVACVRKHGYDMPNPNLSGTGPVFPASIRTNPKFVAAAKPCESLLVPQRPAGSGGAPGTTTTT